MRPTAIIPAALMAVFFMTAPVVATIATMPVSARFSLYPCGGTPNRARCTPAAGLMTGPAARSLSFVSLKSSHPGRIK